MYTFMYKIDMENCFTFIRQGDTSNFAVHIQNMLASFKTSDPH